MGVQLMQFSSEYRYTTGTREAAGCYFRNGWMQAVVGFNMRMGLLKWME